MKAAALAQLVRDAHRRIALARLSFRQRGERSLG